MATVIAVANQKGGVGKTTTTLNLGVALAYLAQEVLVVDLDSQANLTSGLGFSNAANYDVSDVLLDPSLAYPALIHSKVEFLSLLPSSGNLVGIELLLKDLDFRETRLKQALSFFSSQYKYILIDCPPSLGLLTVNALVAADQVLIPMTAEYYALEGLTLLNKTIKRIQETQNVDLKLLGIVLTMFDSRLQLSQAVVGELREYFPDHIFDTWIPRNVRIAEAPSFSLPIQIYAPKSPGAQAFMDLGKEALLRLEIDSITKNLVIPSFSNW